MYGFGDEFQYLRCGTCGCQQIVTVPENPGKYYPSDYYSYAPTPMGGLRQFITVRRNRSYFTRGPSAWLGRLVAGVLPNPALAAVATLERPKAARVLDVGCGYGGLLMELRSVGFTSLTGIDPYTQSEGELADGVVVRRMDLEELGDETFDVIVMNHVFEHMPDPIGALRRVAALLSPDGIFLMRIPVADSWASRHYGALWMQHDAPRHLFLHTEESISRAAAKAEMKVTDVVYDSSEAQFWGSELYERGVALRSVPLSIYGNPFRRLFSPTFLRYRRAARRLNREKQGDQASFYLRRAR